MAYEDLPKELQEKARDAIQHLATAHTKAENSMWEARRCGDFYRVLLRFASSVLDCQSADTIAKKLQRDGVITERDWRDIRNEGSRIVHHHAIDIAKSFKENCEKR